MEKRTPVKIYEVAMICDQCNEGNMKFTQGQTNHPQFKFVHVCEKCGAIAHTERPYPYLFVEKIVLTGIKGGKELNIVDSNIINRWFF